MSKCENRTYPETGDLPGAIDSASSLYFPGRNLWSDDSDRVTSHRESLKKFRYPDFLNKMNEMAKFLTGVEFSMAVAARLEKKLRKPQNPV
jgi:hypothetical protein